MWSAEYHLSDREQPLQYERRQHGWRAGGARLELAPKTCAARRLRSSAQLGTRTDWARSQGTAGSAGLAQCHIHTGYSSSAAPVRSHAVGGRTPHGFVIGMPVAPPGGGTPRSGRGGIEDPHEQFGEPILVVGQLTVGQTQ